MLKRINTVFALCAFAVCAFAQQATPGQTQGQTEADKSRGGQQQSGTTASADRRFLTEAAQGGLAEVSLGRLALERAASADVKQYAQRMIDDHTKSNNELMQIAQGRGVTLPTEPNAQHRAMMRKMEKLSGADFEREYMRSQLKDHEKMTALFERQGRSARDAEVKAFAEKTLPSLHEHHQMARDVATKVGVTTAGAGKKGDKGDTVSGKPKQ
jgi:putative membrane protein